MLTRDQLVVLRDDLKARGLGVVLDNPGAEAKLLAVYNEGTDLLAWKPSLMLQEVLGALVWSEMNPPPPALSLLLTGGTVELTAGVRAGLPTVLDKAPESLTAIMALATRPVSVFERLFVDTKEQPALLAVEGPMTTQHVKDALGVSGKPAGALGKGDALGASMQPAVVLGKGVLAGKAGISG